MRHNDLAVGVLGRSRRASSGEQHVSFVATSAGSCGHVVGFATGVHWHALLTVEEEAVGALGADTVFD